MAPRRAPAAARPPRARYHHGELRQALMEAALVLVRSHGPEGFTLREAARRAGVASAAPYRHFSSRRALLAAVAEEGYRRLHAALLRAAPAELPPVDRLREFGVAYVRFAARNTPHFRVMFSAGLADRREFPSLDEASRAPLALVLEVVRACQAEGRVRGGDPHEVALACWSLTHGLAALALDGQLGGTPLRRRSEVSLAEALVRLLYVGLAPAHPGGR